MESEREHMVQTILAKYKKDLSSVVISAMLQVPRHEFVPNKYIKIAYNDNPVPIGFGQTMSQPYTVAYMTHLLVGGEKSEKRIIKNWKVLEVGTGSGYQAAVLSKLVKEVFTVEIIPELAEKAKETLKKLDYKNVHVKSGSGEWGWEEKSPFDAIIVTAGIDEKVPEILFRQLAEGGSLVAPIGKGINKVMTKYIKTGKRGKKDLKKEEYGIFRFVPFIEESN